MIYRTIPPAANLRNFVRMFWYLECDLKPGTSYIQRTMADGNCEWVFHYRGVFDEVGEDQSFIPSFLSGLSGQHARFRRFKIDCSFGIFGVYLFPYTIPLLFGLPACDVSGQMPETASLLGTEGNYLEEQMISAANNNIRLEVMTKFLQFHLADKKPDPRLVEAIRKVNDCKGQVSIDYLADFANLSPRQLERKFKEYAGFTPKLYSRITRFQSVFKEFKNGISNLTDIAYQCGYYDQSHFIQDFKAFSGFSPLSYLKDNSSESINWVS